MVNEIIGKKENEFEKSLDFLRKEMAKLRTGRANAGLVENMLVDYYGGKSPMKQIASITIPEARTIAISPWSRDSLVNIEKAIRESDLNLNPVNDGQVVRINIPQLNEERRRDLVKVLNQKAEEARIAVRRVREEIWEEIQNLEKQGSVAEDEKFSAKDKLQEIVDDYNGKIEEIRKKKEEEIMTV